MRLSATDMDYVSGEKFDDGYIFKFERNRCWERLNYITETCKGKNVLHIGCCDHIPLIKGKIEQKIWLQGLLEDVANICIGVDIESEAVSYVRQNNFSQNVYYADVTGENFTESIPDMNYNCVVLGEILEHVDNPVLFLHQLRTNLLKMHFHQDGIIVITVPNLYKMQRFSSRQPKEIINTDHRYWFSPFTLAKVLYRGGMLVQEIVFVDYTFFIHTIDRLLGKYAPKLRELVLRKNSYRSNGLIAIASILEEL